MTIHSKSATIHSVMLSKSHHPCEKPRPSGDLKSVETSD